MQAKSSVPQSATEDLPLPIICTAEWRDLEAEAGRPFVSSADAHRYRLQQIHRQAVNEMLAEAVRR
jgi:hypothetical protein